MATGRRGPIPGGQLIGHLALKHWPMGFCHLRQLVIERPINGLSPFVVFARGAVIIERECSRYANENDEELKGYFRRKRAESFPRPALPWFGRLPLVHRFKKGRAVVHAALHNTNEQGFGSLVAGLGEQQRSKRADSDQGRGWPGDMLSLAADGFDQAARREDDAGYGEADGLRLVGRPRPGK